MILGVIPARFASTRFPGKPLALIGGVPMVVRVLRRAEDSGVFEAIVVATDDERIAAEVDRFGGAALMTSVDCPNGTMRSREATQACEAASGKSPEAVINIQGDEPFVHPDSLRTLAELILVTSIEGLPLNSDAPLLRALQDRYFRAVRNIEPHPFVELSVLNAMASTDR